MSEGTVKFLTILVISLLIAIYNGIKGGIARIADDRRRYMTLKMFNLNVIALIPCIGVSLLVGIGISKRQFPTYNELETIGLKCEYVTVNQEKMTILSRIDDGKQLYSTKGWNQIEIMNNGDLVVCPDSNDDNVSTVYLSVDGIPVSRATAFYYRLFDELHYPYYGYVLWGTIIFLMIAVNVIGHSIYSSKATLLALKNDILA